MPRNASSKASSKTSSKTSSKAAHRASKASTYDALHILSDDHKNILEMFDEFKQMKDERDTDDDAKQELVESACTELTIHAQVEEEVFYPAARDALDNMDLLDEAEVEHASARQLISELSAMQPGDDLYDAKFTVLGEYVRHHIQEEEKKLFPKLKKADIDLEELGEEIGQRKLELRDELGVPSEIAEDEDEDEVAGKPHGRKNVH